MLVRAQELVRTFVDDCLDVVLSRACVHCDRPGSLVCESCALMIPSIAKQREFHHELWFGASYETTVREMINAHKDHGARALTSDLGLLLARAVWSASVSSSYARPVVIVPIPAHRSSLRKRGRDTVMEIAESAASQVASRGIPCVVRSLLIREIETKRNAGRSLRQRRDVHGTFGVRSRGVIPARVIVVDDIVTTGATVNEGVRALLKSGIGVDAISCVASTPLPDEAPLRSDG